MVTSDEYSRFVGIAWRLDRLRWVPVDVLADIVMKDGACVWAFAEGDPPELTGHDAIDRELAARLCAGCPVQDECLELELRTAGEQHGRRVGLAQRAGPPRALPVLAPAR